jgi:competence protein ComEA
VQEGLGSRIEEIARRAGLRGVSARAAVAAGVVLAVAVGWGVWRWWPQGAGEVPLAAGPAAVPSQVSSAAVAATAPASTRVWVHVVGAVRHPGLYGLDEGARVDAALDAAGGLLGNAEPAAVNLARKVTDGEQIAVPSQDEARRAGGAAGQSGAGTQGAPGSGTKVDLNSATTAQLDSLPGIGPATAAKILADRQANGPYGSLDDLGRVTGIGPKRLEELKDLVIVR